MIRLKAKSLKRKQLKSGEQDSVRLLYCDSGRRALHSGSPKENRRYAKRSYR